jgi:hypothetical protein
LAGAIEPKNYDVNPLILLDGEVAEATHPDTLGGDQAGQSRIGQGRKLLPI